MIFRSNLIELGRAERHQRSWSGQRLAGSYRLPAGTSIDSGLTRALHLLGRHAKVCIALMALAGLLALSTLLLLIPTGMVVVAPGRMMSADTIMRLDGTSPTKATAHAVVVDRRSANLLDLARRQLTHDLRIEHPDHSDRVVQSFGDDVLNTSFVQARFAALVELGIPARFTADRVVVTAVRPDSPLARAGVHAGDSIVRVGTNPVSSSPRLVELIDAAPRTAPLDVTLADGRRLSITLPSRTSLPHIRQAELKQELGTIILSIDAQVRTAPAFHATFQPSFEGGSAGLAVGAASLQSGGLGIHAPPYAATGALYADGSVGPVDDVTAKVEGVAATSVRFFLVPRDNLADARAADAPGVEIVPVDSLADVTRWLSQWDRPTSSRKDH